LAEKPTEDDIEITPEMVKAGVTAFLNFDSRFESEVEAVMDIYKALVTARYHTQKAADFRLVGYFLSKSFKPGQ
jgi:hypothetical protein